MVLLQEVTDEASWQNKNENVCFLSWLNILQYFCSLFPFPVFFNLCAVLCHISSHWVILLLLVLYSPLLSVANHIYTTVFVHVEHCLHWLAETKPKSILQFLAMVPSFIRFYSSSHRFFYFSALGDKKGRFSCFQQVGEKEFLWLTLWENLMSIWKA